MTQKTDPMLVSWIGSADLNGPDSDPENCGPLARILAARSFGGLLLMNDFGASDPRVARYLAWLGEEWLPRGDHKLPPLRRHDTAPCGGLGLGEIYDLVAGVLADERAVAGRRLSFNLSSGTPAMQFAFLLLARTACPGAELVQPSREQGVRTVSFPFEVTRGLTTAIHDAFIEGAHAAGHAGRADTDAVDRAATNSLPVLIVGEPGTGKTTVARRIHDEQKLGGKLVDVYCASVSDDVFDAAFFGFDRSQESRIKDSGLDPNGFLSGANDGSVLLRDVDALTAAGQARLMGALRARSFSRVGSVRPIKMSCRFIATTSKDPWEEARQGRFRTDLLYSLATNVIEIPPLRGRRDEIPAIARSLLEGMPRSLPKRLSAEAQALLKRQDWPGNIHELKNVLARAAIRATSDATVEAADIHASLWRHKARDDVMERPLGDGFGIDTLLREVRQRYVARALDTAGQNSAQAAQLLGISRQRLANWQAEGRSAAGAPLG